MVLKWSGNGQHNSSLFFLWQTLQYLFLSSSRGWGWSFALVERLSFSGVWGVDIPGFSYVRRSCCVGGDIFRLDQGIRVGIGGIRNVRDTISSEEGMKYDFK